MPTISIPLANGKGAALIDAADEPLVAGSSWYRHSQGYAAARVKGRLVLMHRLLLNPPPGLQVDHRNRDRLDCRRENLRVATHSQNGANARKRRPRSSTPSRFKGVTWHGQRGKWQARGRHLGRKYHLGLYEDEVEAARAYDRWARERHGEFARINFPEVGEEAA